LWAVIYHTKNYSIGLDPGGVDPEWQSVNREDVSRAVIKPIATDKAEEHVKKAVVAVEAKGPGSSILIAVIIHETKTLLEARIAWEDMIVSAILAQKKEICQWIDPSKIIIGRNPRFVQQSSMEILLSIMATVMGSGGILTTPTKNAEVACDKYICAPVYKQ
jgi:hypothetical protein